MSRGANGGCVDADCGDPLCPCTAGVCCFHTRSPARRSWVETVLPRVSLAAVEVDGAAGTLTVFFE